MYYYNFVSLATAGTIILYVNAVHNDWKVFGIAMAFLIGFGLSQIATKE